MISENILNALLDFRKQRDWQQFHTPRNISASICIEASELLEIFQWAKDEDLSEIINLRREEIEFEIADLVMLITYFCHDHHIDVDEVIKRKMMLNEKKIPH